MFALVDCDHFYASCERVFRPDLWRRPVAVLSNNDGCVIARSPEVKALGVKMGAPLFECRSLFHAHQVQVFSANFSLYADLSARVMEAIRESVSADHDPRVEVYSIDEAFVDLSDVSKDALGDFAHQLRDDIARQVGIPVSIGVAPTKTLAKVATWLAKRERSGVSVIASESARINALRRLPIGEVWGIGRRWSERLKRIGVERAIDLAEASETRINYAARHQYLRRAARELNGERCITLELHAPPRASVRYSRTFARKINDPRLLHDALNAFAGNLGQRLRTHDLRAGTLIAWLTAHIPRNRGRGQRGGLMTYTIKASASLPVYTHDTPTLIQLAHHLTAQLISRATYEAPSALTRPVAWRKAGLLALDLRDDTQRELGIVKADPRRQKLSELEDLINQRFGRGSARIGGLPIKATGVSRDQRHVAPAWAPQRAALSPRYTTNWAELPVVRA